jgi:hypothetical protein
MGGGCGLGLVCVVEIVRYLLPFPFLPLIFLSLFPSETTVVRTKWAMEKTIEDRI